MARARDNYDRVLAGWMPTPLEQPAALVLLAAQPALSRGRWEPKVQAVTPHLGHYESGIVLNVSGTKFTADYGDTRCRFGATQWTRATIESATHLLCRTPDLGSQLLDHQPSSAGAGGVATVPLEVTMNGAHYSTSSTLFTIFDLHAVNISVLVPAGGPASGDTAVTVHGANFKGPGYRGERGRLPPASAAKATAAQHVACVWCARQPSNHHGLLTAHNPTP